MLLVVIVMMLLYNEIFHIYKLLGGSQCSDKDNICSQNELDLIQHLDNAKTHFAFECICY